MVTNDKDIKIRNAKEKVEAGICLEAIFHFLDSNHGEESFYGYNHHVLGECGVYVYQTKTLIVARYQRKRPK